MNKRIEKLLEEMEDYAVNTVKDHVKREITYLNLANISIKIIQKLMKQRPYIVKECVDDNDIMDLVKAYSEVLTYVEK